MISASGGTGTSPLPSDRLEASVSMTMTEFSIGGAAGAVDQRAAL